VQSRGPAERRSPDRSRGDGSHAGLHVSRRVPTVRVVLVLFLFALVLLAAWFIAVVAFHVAAAGIHLLLVVALVLFAVGFMRRRFARPHRPAV
jgi:Flp pilus assembly protein TadB